MGAVVAMSFSPALKIDLFKTARSRTAALDGAEFVVCVPIKYWSIIEPFSGAQLCDCNIHSVHHPHCAWLRGLDDCCRSKPRCCHHKSCNSPIAHSARVGLVLWAPPSVELPHPPGWWAFESCASCSLFYQLELTAQLANGHHVQCLAFSPNAHIVAAGLTNGTIELLDGVTLQPICSEIRYESASDEKQTEYTLRVAKDKVLKLAFSADSRYLAFMDAENGVGYLEVVGYLASCLLLSVYTGPVLVQRAMEVYWTLQGSHAPCR